MLWNLWELSLGQRLSVADFYCSNKHLRSAIQCLFVARFLTYCMLKIIKLCLSRSYNNYQKSTKLCIFKCYFFTIVCLFYSVHLPHCYCLKIRHLNYSLCSREKHSQFHFTIYNFDIRIRWITIWKCLFLSNTHWLLTWFLRLKQLHSSHFS